MIPKRRVRPKMGVRESERVRCSGHLAWTRGNRCLVENAECSGNMEAPPMKLVSSSAHNPLLSEMNQS